MPEAELGIVVRARDEASQALSRLENRLQGMGQTAGGLARPLQAAGRAAGGMVVPFRTAGRASGGMVAPLKASSGALSTLKTAAVAAGTAIAGIFAIRAGIGLFTGAIESASDLNETINKVEVVFGEASEDIKVFAQTAAQSLGMSRNEAMAATGTFGNLFVTMGMGPKAAADMSIDLVKLAGDIASFQNLRPEDVLEKLRSGLVGEVEPLRAVGILLTEEVVKQKALEMGLAATGKELTQAQKVQARYALILEQSTTAQGDFARTSTGMANAMRIIRASFKDISAQIGERLLPVVAPLVSAFATALPRAMNLLGPMADRVGDALGRLANLIGSAFGRAATWGRTLLSHVQRGDWGGVGGFILSSLRGAVSNALSVVGNLFDQWAPKWVVAAKNAVARGDWTGAAGLIGVGISDALRDALDGVGKLFPPAVREWVKALKDHIQEGDWAGAWRLLSATVKQEMLDPLTDYIDRNGPDWAKATKYHIQRGDWGATLKVLKTQILDLLEQMSPTLEDWMKTVQGWRKGMEAGFDRLRRDVLPGLEASFEGLGRALAGALFGGAYVDLQDPRRKTTLERFIEEVFEFGAEFFAFLLEVGKRMAAKVWEGFWMEFGRQLGVEYVPKAELALRKRIQTTPLLPPLEIYERQRPPTPPGLMPPEERERERPVPLVPHTPFGLPEYQRGGIVRRPTVAVLGERGPEAIVPLSQVKPNINVEVNVSLTPDLADIRGSILRQVWEATDEALRRAGFGGAIVSSGAYMPG